MEDISKYIVLKAGIKIYASDLEGEFIFILPVEVIQGFGCPPLQCCGRHTFCLSWKDTKNLNTYKDNGLKPK
jgi:hypothetical protein